MGTSNAYHMLILPILQCTAGIFATLAIIWLARFVTGRRPAIGSFVEPRRSIKGSADVAGFRLSSRRPARAHAEKLGVLR